MKQYNVGVIGATDEWSASAFVTLLAGASSLVPPDRGGRQCAQRGQNLRGGGRQPLADADADAGETPRKLIVQDAAQVEKIAAQVDFVFCAVNMKKRGDQGIGGSLCQGGMPGRPPTTARIALRLMSPMVVPEINADHIEIIPAPAQAPGHPARFYRRQVQLQPAELCTRAASPARVRHHTDVLVCTYQAISGAGKTFETFPEIVDNVIPYIGGEEEKSEQEPPEAVGPHRGPTQHRFRRQPPALPHSACGCRCPTAIWARSLCALPRKPSQEEILQAWKDFRGPAQELELPSAPKQFPALF